MSNNAAVRVALVQAFSADKALGILADFDQATCPGLVLVPEYCLRTKPHLDQLRGISAARPKMEVITAMVLGDTNRFVNSAISFKAGTVRNIYNKIDDDGGYIQRYTHDTSPSNEERFRRQPAGRFVTVCMDYKNVRVGGFNPRVWLIPASDRTSSSVVIPPDGFTGHVLFANGSQETSRPSYYLRVQKPFAIGDVLTPEVEIPRDDEGCRIVSIPLNDLAV